MRDPWEDPGLRWLVSFTMGAFLGAVGFAVLAIIGIAKGIHWLAVVGVIMEMPLSMLTGNAGTVLLHEKQRVEKR